MAICFREGRQQRSTDLTADGFSFLWYHKQREGTKFAHVEIQLQRIAWELYSTSVNGKIRIAFCKFDFGHVLTEVSLFTIIRLNVADNLPVTSQERRIAAICAVVSPDSAAPGSVPGALLRWYSHRPAILHAEQQNCKAAMLDRAWLMATLSRVGFVKTMPDSEQAYPSSEPCLLDSVSKLSF